MITGATVAAMTIDTIATTAIATDTTAGTTGIATIIGIGIAITVTAHARATRCVITTTTDQVSGSVARSLMAARAPFISSFHLTPSIIWQRLRQECGLVSFAQNCRVVPENFRHEARLQDWHFESRRHLAGANPCQYRG